MTKNVSTPLNMTKTVRLSGVEVNTVNAGLTRH
jgi:hypothetical protein